MKYEQNLKSTLITYNLDQNELTLHDGAIGIFQSEPDPITFLTTATIDKETNTKAPKVGKDGRSYPRFEIYVQMTNKKLLHKRQVYTLFNILEDFGGFSGSIIMVFKFLMSFYTKRVYQDSISQELPVQAKSLSDRTRHNASAFLQKFSNQAAGDL